MARTSGDPPGLPGTEGSPGTWDFQFGTRRHGFAQDELVNFQHGTCAYGLASGCQESCRFDHVGSGRLPEME